MPENAPGHHDSSTNGAPPAERELPPTGRLAGIDFGTVRIGVAICDPDRRVASPLETYPRKSPEADARFFQQLVRDYGIRGFVIGLPVHMSGQDSQKSIEARRFAAWLEQATAVPCRLYDERFSTAQARDFLGMAGLSRGKSRKRIDMIAAQVILASFLESSARVDPHASCRPIDDTPPQNSQ